MNKCLLCFSENVGETELPYQPFGCFECGAWGDAIEDISKPEPSEDDYRDGQAARRPTAA